MNDNITTTLNKITNILTNIQVAVSTSQSASNAITINQYGVSSIFDNSVAKFSNSIEKFATVVAQPKKVVEKSTEKGGFIGKLLKVIEKVGKITGEFNNIKQAWDNFKSMFSSSKNANGNTGTSTNAVQKVFVTGGSIKLKRNILSKALSVFDKIKSIAGKSTDCCCDAVLPVRNPINGFAGGGAAAQTVKRTVLTKGMMKARKIPIVGKGLTKGAIKITKLFRKLGPVMGTVTRVLRPILSVFGRIIPVVGRLLPVLGRIGLVVAGLTPPIALAIGIIMAIVTAVQVVIKSFEWLWENIAEFRGMIAVIGDIFAQVWEKLVGFFSAVGQAIWEFIEPAVQPLIDLWNKISQIFSGIYKSIKESIGSFFGWITDKLIKVAGFFGLDTDRLEKVRKEAEKDPKKKEKKEFTLSDAKGKSKKEDSADGAVIKSSHYTAKSYSNAGVSNSANLAGVSQKAITINSLIQTLNINVTNLKESAVEVKSTVKKVLLDALRDVEIEQNVNVTKGMMA